MFRCPHELFKNSETRFQVTLVGEIFSPPPRFHTPRERNSHGPTLLYYLHFCCPPFSMPRCHSYQIIYLSNRKKNAMTSKLPVIGLAAAAEAFAITIFLPQYLPHNPFVWTLIRTTSLNFGLYILYQLVIYPYFLSPLRHLPGPGVSTR